MLTCMSTLSDGAADCYALQDPPVKPPAASCRMPGRVVQLLTSNNAQVAMTLQISSHDDGESVKHVVKVRHF